MFGNVTIQRGPAREKPRLTKQFVADRLARLDAKEQEMGTRIDNINAERARLKELVASGTLPDEA